MTLSEFDEKYKHLRAKDKIEVTCNCGDSRIINKEKARVSLAKNGCFKCRKCASTDFHIRKGGISEETKDKIRKANTGRNHSEETKRKCSELKKEYYQSEKGIETKKKLSVITSKQHQNVSMDKFKIKGSYFSDKANKFIGYMSSYELKYGQMLENDPNVLIYDSQVPYVNEDGYGRSLDFKITHMDGSILISEVKPSSRIEEYEDQLEDSKNNAIKNGRNFTIITEKELGGTDKEIRDWAKKFVEETGINENTKNADIKTKRVDVYCDFCDKTHNIYKRTYNLNVSKNNGVYICKFNPKNKDKNNDD